MNEITFLTRRYAFTRQDMTLGGGYVYFPERDENIGNEHVKQLLQPTLHC